MPSVEGEPIAHVLHGGGGQHRKVVEGALLPNETANDPGTHVGGDRQAHAARLEKNALLMDADGAFLECHEISGGWWGPVVGLRLKNRNVVAKVNACLLSCQTMAEGNPEKFSSPCGKPPQERCRENTG